MANLVERQITLEAQRNVIVKWAGVLDTSNFTLTPALALTDCVYNDPQNKLVGFRLDHIEWSMTDGLEIVLAWNASVPQLITPISGRGRINMWSYGGFVPDQTRTGYTGDLNLTSTGWTTGILNFTVTLELIKLYGQR